MPLPDSTAGAALSSPSFVPAWVAWLDILGDPVRVTTAGVSLSFSGTGDSDLDGFTFTAVDPTMVNLSPIQNREGGADTVTASLSGIVGPDTDLLNAIGDKANWLNRTARFWAVIYDANGVQQGAAWNFFTGRMASVRIEGDPSSQTVMIDIETYLATLNGASGRTYADQQYFDAGDLSFRLTIGAANGATKGVKPEPGSLFPNSPYAAWFR